VSSLTGTAIILQPASLTGTTIILPAALGTIILPPGPPPPSRPHATFGTNDQLADAEHNCLAFEDADPAAPCSTPFVGDAVGISLGPVPSAGILISDPHAVTDDAPTGDGLYAVDVLVDGGGAPVLSCHVTASSVPAGTCTAAGASPTVTGGHFLLARITNEANTGTAEPAHWRVSFTY
jgi:hypothetical protein